MKAMVMTDFGGPEVLQLGEYPDPEPRPHDLLLRVEATSINPVDCKTRQAPRWGDRHPPMILGFDVCGIVEAVGESSAGFSEGDRVMASPDIVRDGAYAERVCVDARTAIRVPEGLSPTEAAALPLVTLTAWESLHDHARCQGGETVLVQAGAGGVGHIAIQLAKAQGCRVLATAGRDESEALARESGAEEVIRYDRADVAETVLELTGGRGAEVVLDLVGGPVFEASVDALAPRGRLVTIVPGVPGDAINRLFGKNGSVHLEFMGAALMSEGDPHRHRTTLESVAMQVESGALRPHVSRVWEMGGIPDAHRAQEAGRTLGKQVVAICS